MNKEEMAAYMRKWRRTSPKYKAWRMRLAQRRNAKYQNDPEYREMCKARYRDWYARKKAEELAGKDISVPINDATDINVGTNKCLQ